MGDRKPKAQFKIDLDRVVSDPKYRREILRRLRHDDAPTHYRPASSTRYKPVVPVPEPPKETGPERRKPPREPGADEGD